MVLRRWLFVNVLTAVVSMLSLHEGLCAMSFCLVSRVSMGIAALRPKKINLLRTAVLLVSAITSSFRPERA